MRKIRKKLKTDMAAETEHGNRHIILAVAYAILNSSKVMFVYISIVTDPAAYLFSQVDS